MARLAAGLRLFVVTITLALLFWPAAFSWAGASGKEVCDVNPDVALGLEDYATAIALHLKVLRAHNDNALVHYHLGFAYGMTGRSTDEIREYRAAAGLGLREWDLFLNVGLAYLGQGDSQRAIGALRTAVLLGPDHPEPHFNLAIAYEARHQFHEALREITASLRLAPSDPDAHNTKAIICSELGDLACARDEWTHLVQVAPYYMPAHINLAVLLSHTSSAALSSSSAQPQQLRTVTFSGPQTK
jgi:Flp pilus assembly protein TadD